jgi:hypothetical protein
LHILATCAFGIMVLTVKDLLTPALDENRAQ